MTMQKYDGPKGHPVPPKRPDGTEKETSQSVGQSDLSPTSVWASDEQFHSHLENVANDLYGHGVPHDFSVSRLKTQG